MSSSAPRRVSSLIKVLGLREVELEVIGPRVGRSGDAPNISNQSLVSFFLRYLKINETILGP